MKTYLATFKPMEPYFFGNEKTLVYPEAKGLEKSFAKSQLSNSYYIKSEYVPSQSTILGTLRYLLLPVKRSDWKYSDEEKCLNNEAVGANSFNPSVNQTFGKIKKISPIFLHNGITPLIPTPFDHIIYKDYDSKAKNPGYTPFSNYKEICTLNGDALYTEQYEAKAGITSAYMQLSDGKIINFNELFTDVTRVGINCSPDKKGLFKKTYRQLNEVYAFAVYLMVEDDLIPQDDVVYMGQGKSTFAVSFKEEENTINEKIKDYLRDDVIYFFGDAFVSSEIYEKCLFAVTKTKTYRAFSKKGNSVSKALKLYHLISAGSVVIPKDKNELIDFVKNENVSLIGYNEIISK